MQKIVILGTSGCGKTTLGAELSRKIGATHIDLDEHFWLPGWQSRSREEFLARIETEKAKGPKWVLSGNYHNTRQWNWQGADTIIWLDYSFSVIASRLLWRTLRRSLKSEKCCNGNEESLLKAFFSRDSILLWFLKTYWRHKRDYPKLFRNEYHNLKIIINQSPRETNQFLAGL